METTDIHEESSVELVKNVMEPHNLEEYNMASLNSSVINDDSDRALMSFASQIRVEVHAGLKCVWDPREERIRIERNSDDVNPNYQRVSNGIPYYVAFTVKGNTE